MSDRFSPTQFEKFRQYGFDPDKLAVNAERQDKRGQQSVGVKFRVGTKGDFASGTIVSVRFCRYDFTRTGKSLKLLWTITMQCGPQKTLREFTVARLPKGD